MLISRVFAEPLPFRVVTLSVEPVRLRTKTGLVAVVDSVSTGAERELVTAPSTLVSTPRTP